MMRTGPILLIDNFDSFTFNIVHLLRDLGAEQVDVRRNHQLPLDRLKDYHAVIASPGPGLPEQSGDLLIAIEGCLRQNIPYLGICLGHQALGVACGGRLKRLTEVAHGVQHSCHRLESQHDLMEGLPSSFDIGRYHSWIIEAESLPDQLQALAQSDDAVLQAIAHRHSPAFGLQFHPESIMSADIGAPLIHNFLQIARHHVAQHTT